MKTVEQENAPRVIRTITTCDSDEHPYLRGHRVRIVAVMKGAAAPAWDPDDERAYLRDDDAIARAGGVTAADRVEVQPWIERDGRWGFATSNPRAVDLACFARLDPHLN